MAAFGALLRATRSSVAFCRCTGLYFFISLILTFRTASFFLASISLKYDLRVSDYFPISCSVFLHLDLGISSSSGDIRSPRALDIARDASLAFC